MSVMFCMGPLTSVWSPFIASVIITSEHTILVNINSSLLKKG